MFSKINLATFEIYAKNLTNEELKKKESLPSKDNY